MYSSKRSGLVLCNWGILLHARSFFVFYFFFFRACYRRMHIVLTNSAFHRTMWRFVVAHAKITLEKNNNPMI